MTMLKQQQRSARRLARKQAAVPKVYVSQSSRLVAMTPSFMGDYVITRLLRRMDETIVSVQGTITRFAEKLAEDPYYAFEWSSSPVEAAAKKRAAETVKYNIAEAQSRDDGYEGGSSRQTFRWTVQWLRSEVVRGAMYPNRDATPRLLVAAYANILQDVEMTLGMYSRELELQ